MRPPFAWCARLAAASDDVLAAAFDALSAEYAPKVPELVRLAIARESFEDTKGTDGAVWWLHVAVVLRGAAARDKRDLDQTHPQLARAINALAERWTHAWPVVHRYEASAKALGRYHTAPAGLVIPAPPPPRLGTAPSVASKPSRPTPTREEPVAAPPQPAPPSTQRSLFG